MNKILLVLFYALWLIDFGVANPLEGSKGSYASVVLTSDPHELIFGDEQAEHTVIEYTALSCEVCAHFHQKVFPEIQKKYINTGRVRFIIRQFPIDQYSLKATALVNQVPPIRRAGAIEQLFAEQKNWLGSQALPKLAAICKLPEEKCHSIMEDQGLLDETLRHRLEIEKFVNIEGTPTFFINGKMYATSLTLDQFDQLIAQKGAPEVIDSTFSQKSP